MTSYNRRWILPTLVLMIALPVACGDGDDEPATPEVRARTRILLLLGDGRPGSDGITDNLSELNDDKKGPPPDGGPATVCKGVGGYLRVLGHTRVEQMFAFYMPVDFPSRL
jgi:hypothetical protein